MSEVKRYYVVPTLFLIVGFVFQTLSIFSFDYLYMTSCSTWTAYVTLLDVSRNLTMPFLRASYFCNIIAVLFYGIIWGVENEKR